MGNIHPWREWVLILACSVTLNLSSHEQCWNCSSQCSRCVRGSVPWETIVMEFYSGLFAAAPELNKQAHNVQLRSIWASTTERYQYIDYTLQDCCKTEVVYDTINSTTLDGVEYRVVQLKQMFQFVPIGVCREGQECIFGECVQRYRAHWVLVHDDNTSLDRPPLRFIPTQVKSHCECLNVGRPAMR